MTTLIIGDSFIGPFTLIDSPDVKFLKISGATLKGLTKVDNPNRKKIIDAIKKNKKLRNVVFCFGNVDIHLSYYYKQIIQGEDFEYKTPIEDYVAFVKSIKTKATKTILNVFPSVLSDANVIGSLKKYIGFIDTDLKFNQLTQHNLKEMVSHEARYKRYAEFTSKLKKESRLKKIKFKDFGKKIVKKDGIPKPVFQDVSSVNIHIRWEPLIKLIAIDRDMNKMGIKKEFLKDLKESSKKYLKEKEKIMKLDELSKDFIKKKKQFIKEKQKELKKKESARRKIIEGK